MERVSIIDLNPPCVCGHDFHNHRSTYSFASPTVCKECYRDNESGGDSLFPYHLFKLDNLKYLEMLSKEKEVADLNKI